MRHASRRSPTRQSGFTLIEVVVTLILVGILGALAYPKIDVGRYKADAVVTTVRSTMQQAQRASLVGQHDIIVSFDVGGNRIRLAWDRNNNHLIDEGERVTWTSLSQGNRFATPTRGVHGDVDRPVMGSNLKSLDDYPTVTFHRDGSLSSELEIYMSSFSTPVRWRAVTVVQATGRTDWFRKNTNTDQAGWVSGVL
jgi:prepilin-type N-terminal cleavage/methylation domain-containing protein